MDLFGSLSCALSGHDWIYRKKFRVCDYCGKKQRL